MNKHTPGPWNVERTIKTAINGNNKHVAMVNWGRGIGEEEHQANVNLIAAAPELLEAAQKALEDCVDLIATEAGIALEKAIAKAKGES